MAVDERRARQLMIAAALCGLALRLAFGLLYWTGKPLTHDEQEYLSLARSLAAGHGFVYDATLDTGTGQQFGRAPGYPLLLAALGAGGVGAGSSPARVKIVQSAIGAGTVWLIGVWALRTWGRRAGILAAAIAAVYPPLVWMPAYVLSETLYSAVALGAALVLQAAVDRHDGADRQRPAWLLAALAGALAGAGVLVRPDLIFFLPLALVWLTARRRQSLALGLAVASIVVVAPWTIRNFRVHGRLILAASTGGVNFWTGNHPLATGEGDLAANPAIKRADLELRAAHPGLSAEQLEPIYYREALRAIAERPVRWLALVARKAFYVAVPGGASYALHSSRYRVAAIASYLALLPLTVAGLWRLRQAARRPTALFLLAGSAVLVCLAFFPQERYRTPVIDPVLIVCAGGVFARPRPKHAT